MDTAGARILAARLAAGVRTGSTIQLLSEAADGSDARAGDIGRVLDLQEDGTVVVEWEGGLTAGIHPARASYRILAV